MHLQDPVTPVVTTVHWLIGPPDRIVNTRCECTHPCIMLVNCVGEFEMEVAEENSALCML